MTQPVQDVPRTVFTHFYQGVFRRDHGSWPITGFEDCPDPKRSGPIRTSTGGSRSGVRRAVKIDVLTFMFWARGVSRGGGRPPWQRFLDVAALRRTEGRFVPKLCCHYPTAWASATCGASTWARRRGSTVCSPTWPSGTTTGRPRGRRTPVHLPWGRRVPHVPPRGPGRVRLPGRRAVRRRGAGASPSDIPAGGCTWCWTCSGPGRTTPTSCTPTTPTITTTASATCWRHRHARRGAVPGPAAVRHSDDLAGGLPHRARSVRHAQQPDRQTLSRLARRADVPRGMATGRRGPPPGPVAAAGDLEPVPGASEITVSNKRGDTRVNICAAMRRSSRKHDHHVRRCHPGATPAGLAAAISLAKAKRSYVVMDAPASPTESPLADWVPKDLTDERPSSRRPSRPARPSRSAWCASTTPT